MVENYTKIVHLALKRPGAILIDSANDSLLRNLFRKSTGYNATLITLNTQHAVDAFLDLHQLSRFPHPVYLCPGQGLSIQVFERMVHKAITDYLNKRLALAADIRGSTIDVADDALDTLTITHFGMVTTAWANGPLAAEFQACDLPVYLNFGEELLENEALDEATQQGLSSIQSTWLKMDHHLYAAYDPDPVVSQANPANIWAGLGRLWSKMNFFSKK